ncbi:hypothetical protein PROVRUST_07852 [Providencia rustigianii DSM 4541]|uniref:Uncharacterized protein n=1 Tax=Providencia rustigianii DSM 4541 TaxID=500637 RepID=D1P6Q0_9GAMM|nr:hypothetical protein PROVRUST_07852 [Providencia rustigianii DSM 4541]
MNEFVTPSLCHQQLSIRIIVSCKKIKVTKKIKVEVKTPLKMKY